MSFIETRSGGNAPGLTCPMPLPSLRTAFSRRAALFGAVSVAGVTAAALPPAASTLASPIDPDAELCALLDRWHEARAVWDASKDPLDKAYSRAQEAYPPRPDILQWRVSDFPRTSYGRGASDPIGDTGCREYGARGVAWLQRLRPSMQWDEAAEARRRQIVEAHEAWMEARRAIEDATGYTAALEAATAAADAFNETEDAVKLCQTRTLTGLARKALWVADLLARDAGEDDLGEVFARQVAAFGGAVDARPAPDRPTPFDATAFLADLEATGPRAISSAQATATRPSW